MDSKFDEKSQYQFFDACNKDNCERIKMFLEQGFPINSHVDSSNFYRNFDGYTPLHFAVNNRNIKTIKYLLEKGADITAKNDKSRTPVHLAFDGSHDSITLVKTLFEYSKTGKTYDNAVDEEGLSHFHICCALNALAAEKFIRQGENVDSSVSFLANNDYAGWTPLHFAANTNETSIVKLLLEYNANPNIQCGKGITPLHLACRYSNYKPSHLQTVKLLLTFNADVNIKDNKGHTALHIAVKPDESESESDA